MAFQRGQSADDHQNRRIRQNAVPDGLHFIPVDRHHGRKGHNDRQLCDLRGLEAENTDLDPALRAVSVCAEQRNKNQQEHGACQNNHGNAAPDLIIDAADKEHDTDADQRKHSLTGKIVGGIVLIGVSARIARREHHNDTDRDQQDCQNQKRHVEKSALVRDQLGFLLLLPGKMSLPVQRRHGGGILHRPLLSGKLRIGS